MSIKLGRHGQGVTIKKCLNFGVDPITDVDPGLLFHCLNITRYILYDKFPSICHSDRLIFTKLGDRDRLNCNGKGLHLDDAHAVPPPPSRQSRAQFN